MQGGVSFIFDTPPFMCYSVSALAYEIGRCIFQRKCRVFCKYLYSGNNMKCLCASGDDAVFAELIFRESDVGKTEGGEE